MIVPCACTVIDIAAVVVTVFAEESSFPPRSLCPILFKWRAKEGKQGEREQRGRILANVYNRGLPPAGAVVVDGGGGAEEAEIVHSDDN